MAQMAQISGFTMIYSLRITLKDYGMLRAPVCSSSGSGETFALMAPERLCFFGGTSRINPGAMACGQVMSQLCGFQGKLISHRIHGAGILMLT